MTPISYKLLLSNFQRMYDQKLHELITNRFPCCCCPTLTYIYRDKYLVGCQKLDACSKIVENLKDMIELKKPELEIKSKETVEIMKKVEEETVEAEKQKVVVQ